MIKISLRMVRATQEGMALAQRAVRAYVRYAFYSFRDRKGRQSDQSKSVAVDGPRHSLMYSNVEDFFLSQVRSFLRSVKLTITYGKAVLFKY